MDTAIELEYNHLSSSMDTATITETNSGC